MSDVAECLRMHMKLPRPRPFHDIDKPWGVEEARALYDAAFELVSSADQFDWWLNLDVQTMSMRQFTHYECDRHTMLSDALEVYQRIVNLSGADWIMDFDRYANDGALPNAVRVLSKAAELYADAIEGYRGKSNGDIFIETTEALCHLYDLIAWYFDEQEVEDEYNKIVERYERAGHYE